MATIHVDGREYEVDDNDNLLQACLEQGLDLPYFCWHPAMGSVGACRQCAVIQYQDEDDTRGRVVMSCMTPVADGARISLQAPEAREFRASITELLMTNHPHDCPVCEEGGECHLQDMTVMTGHNYRRFRGLKRTHRNQYLGPFLNHEMNRCIACYRCTRFYREYAGGDDLHALASADNVYFGRHEDGVLDSVFSGNLAEVCPTGVFTDRTLSSRYTRKWDLQTAPSVCVHCSLGCNTSPGERAGSVRRIQNRYNGAVNGYFLCDRGRYGYEFANGDDRVREPLAREPDADAARSISVDEAVDRATAVLSGARGYALIGIGSPRASLEANFALRELVGPDAFHAGYDDREQAMLERILEIYRGSPARAPSLRDIESADAVLVLGEDLLNTAPRMALSLRQAARGAAVEHAEKLGIPAWQDHSVRQAGGARRSPIFLATTCATEIDELAAATLHGGPAEIAAFAQAVARALDRDAPQPVMVDSETGALARRVADALAAARRPLIISGTSSHSLGLVNAAANVAHALCDGARNVHLSMITAECNSLGLAMLEPAPLADAFERARQQEDYVVVVLENDLYRRGPRESVRGLLNNAGHCIVIDSLLTATGRDADLVLPAASFAEGDGTLVSSEGRAQRFFQVCPPAGAVRESWRWLQACTAGEGVAGEGLGAWNCLDDVTAACAAAFPGLAQITAAAPGHAFRMHGMRLPRQPHRYSGRTALNAATSVHEPQPAEDPDSPFAFSMEGFHGSRPGSLIASTWSPGWNSVQSLNKFQEEIGGRVRGGDGGVRLLEPHSELNLSWLDPAAEAPAGQGDLLLLPLPQIFGSEELSARGPAIGERTPEPFVAVNAGTAGDLGIEAGGCVELDAGDGVKRQLTLRIIPSLPDASAGVPEQFPGLEGLRFPARASLRRVEP